MNDSGSDDEARIEQVEKVALKVGLLFVNKLILYCIFGCGSSASEFVSTEQI